MIDFIKVQLSNYNAQKLLDNHLLIFSSQVDLQTGEILGNEQFADYKGLRFKVFVSPNKVAGSESVTLEGSLHKYWNNGIHNSNDFNLNSIENVLEELTVSFDIDWSRAFLRCLEVGVNVEPELTSKATLEYFILNRTKRFKWTATRTEGNYIQAESQRHILKVYDKRKHMMQKDIDLEHEVLRFEKKWKRMAELRSLGIRTVHDLINRDALIKVRRILCRTWDDTLFICPDTIMGDKYEYQYRSADWWMNRSKDSRKYHKKRLKLLLEENLSNYRELLRDKIFDKYDKLLFNY